MAMPGGGTEGVLEIAIEGFDVPAHVIEAGEFCSGKESGVQERGEEAASAKTVSMNENYPDRERCFVVVVLDVAEIIPRGESTHYLGTHGFLGGDDEVGMAAEDLAEGGAVVEACVQEKQIALFEAFDELVNEFVFRSACLSVDESHGRTTDQIKQAAKLDSNRAQSLLAFVCAETLPKRRRFGQGESGLVACKQAQPMPTAALVLADFLQPRYQRPVQPGQSLQGKNAHEPCRRRPRKWTIGCQAVP